MTLPMKDCPLYREGADEPCDDCPEPPETTFVRRIDCEVKEHIAYRCPCCFIDINTTEPFCSDCLRDYPEYHYVPPAHPTVRSAWAS